MSRPYDLVSLGLLAGAATLATERRWRAREWLPLVCLIPILGYNLWLFFGSGDYASFRGLRLVRGGLLPLLIATGPAIAIIAATWRSPADARAARARRPLVLWATLVLAVVVLRPPMFGGQFLSGGGVPLLMLAALGLADRGRRWPWIGAALLVPSALVATAIVVLPDIHWFPPTPRYEAAQELAAHCGERDVAMAPPDIGLWILGETRCIPFASHRAATDSREREAVIGAFYGRDPTTRAQLLRAGRLSFVLVPEAIAAAPTAFFGAPQRCSRIGSLGKALVWFDCRETASRPPS